MFYSITGNVVFTDETTVAIECGGVAFRCATSFNTLRKIGGTGQKATLFTYLSVREDALDLFGFYDKDELDCFKMLIAVSGVGPKAALAILSQLTPGKLALAVAAGDVKAITAAQGVGPKIAQRIFVELKDKLNVFSDASDGGSLESISRAAASSNAAEAIEALTALGFSKSESSIAVGKLDPEDTVDNLIKKALAALSSKLM